MFRAVRFGTSEAHGRANLIQFNWLREKGALTLTRGGSFEADLARVIAANRDLAAEVLTIQATGDYERAAAFVSRYAVPPEDMQTAIERLSAVPVDIRPEFAVVDKLAAWQP